MSDRREVNVERPEHSWIPFYRELARKLANPKEGWRKNQPGLVRMLKEMRDEGVMMHSVLDYLDDWVDPFTVFAIIARNLTPENYRSVLVAYKSKFELSAPIPEGKPFIPYIDARKLGYFPGEGDIPRYVSDLWDLFELVWDMDPFAPNAQLEMIATKFDACKRIPGVSTAKLTSGFYIVNPTMLLKNDTINGVIGKDVLDRNSTGADYIRFLKDVGSRDRRSFPEINVSDYKLRSPKAERPNVWIVRGGRDGGAVQEFLDGRYTGVGFFAGFDLSRFHTEDELESLIEEHGLRNDGIDQVTRFLSEIKVGDYVLMPNRGSTQNHYGRVKSDPYHERTGTHNNRRDVEWAANVISQSELDLSHYRYTLTRPNREVQDRFLEIIASVEGGKATQFQMPEDSWVPFHLEMRKRLIEEEMWKPEMREVFSSLVMQVVGAAGGINENMADLWTPDPYSFYLAFNTASEDRDRDAGYDKVRELFEITVPTPERGCYARRYGVHYWVKMRTEEAGDDFLWDFFRFLRDADPVNDSGDEEEFVRRFDTVLSNDVPGMASATLSQWLYWIDPTKYLLTRRIHASELGLAAHLGLTEPIEGGAKYIEALKAVDEFAKSKRRTILDINRESTTREMLGLAPIDPVTIERYGIDDVLAEGVFLERSELERMKRILESKKNLILQGPPGVGKTFIARKLAYVLMGSKTEERITSVQFHQSYSYEDFVGGFRPDVENGQMVFTRQDGPFLKMCAAARANPGDAYVMLIDEINRGNLSRVFGELLMLIEADKRKPEFGVSLQHRTDGDEKFFVPENVYIIGTMNLADRSLTGMNVAMRRRFGFVDLEPQFGNSVFTDWLRDATEMPSEMQGRVNTKMKALNDAIAGDPSLGYNYAVGHSFFCPPEGGPADGWEEWYKTVVDYEIRPLLREYWFDAPDTANAEADKLLSEL